jgi:hypothetical protein
MAARKSIEREHSPMSDTNGRSHAYHAEATILEGHLELPLVQAIKPQAHAKLPEHGGYLAQRAEDYRLESVISFRSAHTQVAGNRDPKPGHGWATLTTTVIEGLNVLDVLTADRVVGQIITEHPLSGYVPIISFLGTRFENLRIAGHPVELDLNLGILGDKPEKDAAYTTNPAVIGRVKSQYHSLSGSKDVPADLGERYNHLASTLGAPEAVECSLVNRATGGYPGQSFGHVIHVPHFGTITLARVSLHHGDFEKKTGVPKLTTTKLTMVDLKLGCAIAGRAGIGSGSTNGSSHP